MKILWLLLLLVPTGYGQSPQPTPPPPFQLNVRVVYPGEKVRPGYAAFIYKALRQIPNVALADEKPDTTLIITETGNGKQYACTFTIVKPANDDVEFYVNAATSGLSTPDTTPFDSMMISGLETNIRSLKPMYYWGDTWTQISESPKVALTNAIKLFDVRVVEKSRRADEDQRRELRNHPAKPIQLPADARP